LFSVEHVLPVTGFVGDAVCRSEEACCRLGPIHRGRYCCRDRECFEEPAPRRDLDLDAGATIAYSDTEAATTGFTVVEVVKSGKTTHRVTIGTFSHHDLNGPDSLPFPSKVGGHALAKGRYQLEATPTLGSFKGKTVVASFAVT
jgi:hypothetical protein